MNPEAQGEQMKIPREEYNGWHLEGCFAEDRYLRLDWVVVRLVHKEGKSDEVI